MDILCPPPPQSHSPDGTSLCRQLQRTYWSHTWRSDAIHNNQSSLWQELGLYLFGLNHKLSFAPKKLTPLLHLFCINWLFRSVKTLINMCVYTLNSKINILLLCHSFCVVLANWSRAHYWCIMKISFASRQCKHVVYIYKACSIYIFYKPSTLLKTP